MIVIDHEPVACTFTFVYLPAATEVCPLVVSCACTPSWDGSAELLLMVKVAFAHPGHCHLSCDAIGTVIVPSDPLPEPLKACGDPPDVDELLEAVVVVVVVRVTVLVVVEWTIRGGCLTDTVFPGVVTVLAGVVTVLTWATGDVWPEVVTVWPGVVTVAVCVTTVEMPGRVATTTCLFAFAWPIT